MSIGSFDFGQIRPFRVDFENKSSEIDQTAEKSEHLSFFKITFTRASSNAARSPHPKRCSR